MFVLGWLFLYQPGPLDMYEAEQTVAEQRQVSDDVIETRFTLKAREVIFNAREAVAQRAAPTIDLPHMLVAILRAEPESIGPLLKPSWSLERVEQLALSQYADKPGVPGHIGHPASQQFSDALLRGVAIADELGHHDVRPLHFLLALFENTTSGMPRLLDDAGITRQEILDSLRR